MNRGPPCPRPRCPTFTTTCDRPATTPSHLPLLVPLCSLYGLSLLTTILHFEQISALGRTSLLYLIVGEAEPAHHTDVAGALIHDSSATTHHLQHITFALACDMSRFPQIPVKSFLLQQSFPLVLDTAHIWQQSREVRDVKFN